MRPPPSDRREKGEYFGNGRKALPLFLPILAPNQSGIGAGKKCLPLVFWRLKSQTYFLCFPDLTIRETRRRETQCFDSREKKEGFRRVGRKGWLPEQKQPLFLFLSLFFLPAVAESTNHPGGEGKRGNSFWQKGSYFSPSPLCWRVDFVSLPSDLRDFRAHANH